MEAPARIRARERGREGNEIIAGQGSEVEDGGKKWGLSHTFPLFPDFKDSPGEKELFSSAHACGFVTLLFYSQKPSTPVAAGSNPY